MNHKNTQFLLGCLVLVVGGCATQDPYSRRFTFPIDPKGYTVQRHVAEPVVQLQRYKSVQTRLGQNPNVAVAVAVSGGGHRSANFALGVLQALEAVPVNGVPVNLLKEVDYFSTVSGGGFAVASYLSSYHDYLMRGGSPQEYSLRTALMVDGELNEFYDPDLRTYTQRSYHSYITPSIFTLLSFGTVDRGDYLEQAINQYVLGSEWRNGWVHDATAGICSNASPTLTLGDVFIPADSNCPVILPYWCANATVFENGAIFPFTPDVLEAYRIDGYSHDLKQVELHNFPQDYFDMPLSVALKASATFPVAVPATTLSSRYDPDNPYLHLFDGGMGDNTGVETAMRLLLQDKSPHKVLFVIDAYNTTTHPFSNDRSSPMMHQFLWRWVNDIPLTSGQMRFREFPGWVSMEWEQDGLRSLDVVYLAFNPTGVDDAYWQCLNRLEEASPYTHEQMAEVFGGDVEKVRENILTDNVITNTVERTAQTTAGFVDALLQPITQFSPLPVIRQARSVNTSFSIMPEQQEILMEAGNIVVQCAASQDTFQSVVNRFVK